MYLVASRIVPWMKASRNLRVFVLHQSFDVIKEELAKFINIKVVGFSLNFATQKESNQSEVYNSNYYNFIET